MTDHSLGQAVPILGITINPDSGDVEPVGGRAADGYEVVVSGEKFSDPLSGLPLFTCGQCGFVYRIPLFFLIFTVPFTILFFIFVGNFLSYEMNILITSLCS